MNKKVLAVGVVGVVAWYAYKALSTSNNTRYDSVSGDGSFLITSVKSTTNEIAEVFMSSPNENLTPSIQLINLLKDYEKKSRIPYYATKAERKKNIQTIGFGHRILKGENFDLPMTDEAIDVLFMRDLNKHIAQIYTVIKVPLNQNQFDALCDFGFNAGASALKTYTGLTNLINAGDFDAAGDRLMKYTMQDGEVAIGLYNRRASEMRMFKYGIYERVG